MNRNWFIVSTKQLQEKKVIVALNSKGIENYCPYSLTSRKIGASTVNEYKPLFKSYVFVYITREEISTVKKISNIIDVVYWKTNPAILPTEEIDAIKMMTNVYCDISLQKSPILVSEKVTISNKTEYLNDGNVISIRQKGLSAVLPTLGYTIIGNELKNENTISKAIEQTNIGTKLGQRLNPLSIFGMFF